MSHRHTLAALVTAAMLALTGASSATAADGHLTPDQQQKVRVALEERGAGAEVIAQVLADDELARTIPVTVTTDEEGSRGHQKVLAAHRGSVTTMSIGSSCTGSQGWVQRTQYLRNAFNSELARFVLRTDFCYDHRRVTFANNTVRASVTVLGTIGGIRYNGHFGISEYFRTWNSRTNGEARSEVQGHFTQSPIRIGELGSVYPIAITYAHYDGTWATGGSCYGCAWW
jgi:hypothetical protein